MIERYLLRYFLAVVDHGNFSRAATHCRVSQPTLSVGIAKLEQTIGTPLFLRSNQRVVLTEAGSRLLLHARRIEREFNLAEQAGDKGALTPLVRIGILHSIAGDIIAEAVSTVDAPKCSAIELIPGSERELLGRLDAERIDVALSLIRPGTDRFDTRPIIDEGYGVALPADHALRNEEEIAAEQLAGSTMIVRRHCEALSATSRYFVDRGIRPHFALRSTNDERVMQMVAAGLGVTVMPLSYRWPGMVHIRLKDFTERRTIGFLFGPRAVRMREEPLPILTAIQTALAKRNEK